MIVPWRVCLVHIWFMTSQCWPRTRSVRIWSPPRLCKRRRLKNLYWQCINHLKLISPWFWLKTCSKPSRQGGFFQVKGLSCCLAVTTWPTTTFMGMESRMPWTSHNFPSNFSNVRWRYPKRIQKVPSWELTYPHPKALFKMMFSFQRIGICDCSLEGIGS